MEIKESFWKSKVAFEKSKSYLEIKSITDDFNDQNSHLKNGKTVKGVKEKLEKILGNQNNNQEIKYRREKMKWEYLLNQSRNLEIKNAI